MILSLYGLNSVERKDLMVKQYELMVLVPSNFSPEQLKATITQISKHVETRGGKVLNSESLGKRQLAYLIKKQNEAFYVLFDLELDTLVAQAFERDIRLMDDVLRELFIIKEKNEVIVATKTDTIDEKVKDSE